MSFCITKTYSNGYRCGCCRSDVDSDPIWTDSWEEALKHVPTEFPVQSEFGGYIDITIVDGATGRTVASSEVSWPPAYRRGDGYKYTKWDLYIQGGRCVEQIIEGVRTTGQVYEPTSPPPIDEVLVKKEITWDEILDDLSKKADQAKIKRLETELEATKKQLEVARGTSG